MVVESMLRNPAYAGDVVWNRWSLAKFFRIANDLATERIDADIRRTFDNPESDWLIARDCRPALVERGWWEAAQRAPSPAAGSR